MPVIAVATSKGGSGKTTLAASLAEWWSREGVSVECIDTDPNKNLAEWLADTAITCRAVEEDAIIDAVAEAVERADVVVIDVAGHLARGMLYAITTADLVVIPCKADRKDVVEACRTQELVASASKMVKRRIPHAAILTQVNRRASVTEHTRNQLSVMEVPTLAADLPARTAYQQASYTGSPVADPTVRDDIAVIAEEIDSLLRSGDAA